MVFACLGEWSLCCHVPLSTDALRMDSVNSHYYT